MISEWDVFVSYSSKDRHIVSIMINDLLNAGLKVWYDQDSVRFGDRIRESINNGIKNSTVVVIVVSTHSLKSRWVLNELDAAMIREINESKTIVLPILIGRIKDQQIPQDISGKNFIDLRHNFIKKYNKQRNKIIHKIRFFSLRTTGQSNIIYEIPLDNSFIKYIIDYQIDKNYLDSNGMPVPRQMLEKIADIVLKGLLEMEKAEAEKKSEENKLEVPITTFSEEFGIFVAQKLILFIIDQKNLETIFPLTEETFEDLYNAIHITILAFYTSRTFGGIPGLGIRLGIDEQGGISYGLFEPPGFSVFGNRNRSSDDTWVGADFGDTVKFHFTVKLDDGTMVETSVNGDPMQVTLGKGQMLASVELGIIRMKPGESKTLHIPAAQAFGPHRKEKILIVDRRYLPKGVNLQVGQRGLFQPKDEEDKKIEFTVIAVSKNQITIDTNHPLADKNLTIDIQVLEVIVAPQDEKQKGHILTMPASD